MEVAGLVVGWRGLSLAVGALLGRPVGIGVVRWRVERSGLAVGKKVCGIPSPCVAACLRTSRLREDFRQISS